MATTTVPGGPGGTPLTFTFGGTAGLTVAQQIANALGAASKAGTLTQTTVSASTGSITIPVTTVAGGVGVSDLIIESTSGPTTVNGASTVPGTTYIVTNYSTTPSTIAAGPNVELFTGTVGGVFSAIGTGAEIGALGGNNTITASGPGETIGGGAGSNLLIATGGDTVVSGGADTISLSGSGNLVIEAEPSVTGAVFITESSTSANDTIVGGVNPTTVTASGTSTVVGSGIQIYAGSGSLTFVGGGTETASILGGTGSESLTAGPGGIVFGANGETSATVNSGTGGATIFGAPGTSVNLTGSTGYLPASSPGGPHSPDYLIAASGNETLNASTSSSGNFFAMGSGGTTSNADMIGGSGNDTMLAGAGAGSVTMTGGAGGSDVFAFFKQVAGGAKDFVTDFNSNDKVFIEGYSNTSTVTGAPITAATVLAGATTATGGGMMLTLSDGTTVTFSNLTSTAALAGKIQYG